MIELIFSIGFGFMLGTLKSWYIQRLEIKYGTKFIWIPRITRNHDGKRLYIWGIWKKLEKPIKLN